MGRILPRCWQTVATAPGSGAITLGSALAGYQTLAAAGAANNDIVSYWAIDGTAWECGQGLYSTTGPTLTRSTFEASSTGAALNLSAAATIYCAPTPRDIAPKIGLDTPLNDQIFNASGTWAKPPVAGSWALVELWGGGAGGGKGATNSNRYGGVGGQWRSYLIPFAMLPAAASVTIGAGGAGATAASLAGAAGGSSNVFGLTAFGGNYIVNMTTSYDTGFAVTTNYVASGSSSGGVLFSVSLSDVLDTAYPADFYSVTLVPGRANISGRPFLAAEYGSGMCAPGTTTVVVTATAPTYAGGRGAGATSANVKINATTSGGGGAGGDGATTTNNTAGVAGSAPGGGGSAGTGTGNGGAGAAGRVRVRIY